MSYKAAWVEQSETYIVLGFAPQLCLLFFGNLSNTVGVASNLG